MIRPLISALLLAVAACAPAANPGRATPVPLTVSAQFESFVDRYLARPQAADEGGDPDLAGIGGLDAGNDRRGAERATRLLTELEAIDTARLAAAQRIDWLLVRSLLRRTIRDTALRLPERVPSRYLTLGDLFWRVTGDRPPAPADWVAVQRDLERAPRALALGRRQLVDPPPLWVALAVEASRSYTAFLRGIYLDRVRAVAPDSLREGLLAAGTAAAGALDGYVAFLSDTLRPAPDTSWQAGAAYYDWVLREVNFLPYTAATMIAEGRRIHEATRHALDSLAAARGRGDWRDLVREMQGRHPAPGAITDAYRKASRHAQALLIRDDLIYIPPSQELHFVPTPPQLRQTYAWGGYGGVQEREGVKIGRFFVTDVVPGMSAADTAAKLRAQNNGWVTVIALHEGYPGHHLQTVYTQRNDRLLRRRVSNTYFGEGWALYAEHWMARAGLYEDPDAVLAQLQMRLWRTARVIIDPSLHTGRMSYGEAVNFFVDEVGLERSAAEAEVNRFTTWPTQAPSYIIGWLEIERLKRDLQARLGEEFAEKLFVERVLQSGSLPLALMRRAVLDAYGLGDDAGLR